MIEVSGLRKSYRTRRGRKVTIVDAVRGVDFSVERGEIFGFLGPNGAGKTTTLQMLATLLRPDGGDAVIAGADLRRSPGQVRRHIGFVAQNSGTYDNSTGWLDLIQQARMYGASKSAAVARAAAVIEAFQLAEFADRKIGTYSGGQRRRLDVALGVIHAPAVIFLDEPTTGLDPQSRARMWKEVCKLRDEGMTIFLTTHYLDEADALCDRISIIDGGLIVAEGTSSDLKREISGDVVIVDMAAPGTAGAPEPATVLEAAKVLADQQCVESCETIDHTLRLYVESGATAIPQIMRALSAKGLEPGAIETRRPSLDDVFLAKTGHTIGDLPAAGKSSGNWEGSAARMKLARDTWLIFQYEAGLMVRNPVTIGVTLLQPVTYLLFFSPFLERITGVNTLGGAFALYVPALFTAMGVYSGLFAGFALLAAMRQGVVTRCRVTPVSRVSLLLGRELMYVLLVGFQALTIVLIAAIFGLRVQPGNVLFAMALLTLIVLMSVSISYDLAFTMPNEHSLATLINAISNPIALIAGVLIPLSFAPLWMRDVAKWNPFAWGANGMQAIFHGHLHASVVWEAMAIMAVLAVVTVVLSARLFSRAVA